jgi:hypothetical protein
MKRAIIKAAVCLVCFLVFLPGYRALAQNGTATATGTVEDKTAA